MKAMEAQKNRHHHPELRHEGERHLLNRRERLEKPHDETRDESGSENGCRHQDRDPEPLAERVIEDDFVHQTGIRRISW